MFSETTGDRDRLQWVYQTKGMAIFAILLFQFFQNYPEPINMVSSLNRTGARLGYADVDILLIMAVFNNSCVRASIFKNNPTINSNIDWVVWLRRRLLRINKE